MGYCLQSLLSFLHLTLQIVMMPYMSFPVAGSSMDDFVGMDELEERNRMG